MTLRDVVDHHLEVASSNHGFNWEVKLMGMTVWLARHTGPEGHRQASLFRAELAARLLVAES